MVKVFIVKLFLIWIVMENALGCSATQEQRKITEKALSKVPEDVPISDIKISVCQCKDAACRVCDEKMKANFKIESEDAAAWAQQMLDAKRLEPNYYFICLSILTLAGASFVFTMTLTMLFGLYDIITRGGPGGGGF